MVDNSGKNFVAIMLVISILGLSLKIALKAAIKVGIAQNETQTSTLLKSVAAALENYAKDNQGLFPSDFSSLLNADPVYLNRDYLADFPVKGYTFHCLRLEPSGYNCSAAPSNCNITGKTIYTITTGGIMITEECGRRD